MWDEILQSSGPEGSWGKWEGKEGRKARQGRMEGEVPSVNEMDRIKENIRTRDRASRF